MDAGLVTDSSRARAPVTLRGEYFKWNAETSEL